MHFFLSKMTISKKLRLKIILSYISLCFEAFSCFVFVFFCLLWLKLGTIYDSNFIYFLLAKLSRSQSLVPVCARIPVTENQRISFETKAELNNEETRLCFWGIFDNLFLMRSPGVELWCNNTHCCPRYLHRQHGKDTLGTILMRICNVQLFHLFLPNNK